MALLPWRAAKLHGIPAPTCRKLGHHEDIVVVLKGSMQLDNVGVLQQRVQPDLSLHLKPIEVAQPALAVRFERHDRA